jgi:hypothetical protein
MTKKIYFAFDFQNDSARVNDIKNSCSVLTDCQAEGFYDHSLWEEMEHHGDMSLKRLIGKSLCNTDVTIVFIGSRTHASRWVRYSIIKSFVRGNKQIGIYLYNKINKNLDKPEKAPNPYDDLAFQISSDGRTMSFYEWQDGRWELFKDYSYECCNYGSVYWHKFFRLSELGFSMYNWADDNGTRNLEEWIGDL